MHGGIMIPKRRYYRIMLGKGGVYSQEAKEKGFIGAGWEESTDLSGQLPDDWRDFNNRFIPIYLKNNPEKTKVAAGLACGMLHTICKGIRIGDIVLSPDGNGSYFVGEVLSDYRFVRGEPLPHRRDVKWYSFEIAKEDMSEQLSNSVGSGGTVCNITKYAEDIEKFLENSSALGSLIPTDVEDPTAFAMEKHLEEFLVHNWLATPLGKNYELFQEEGQVVGRQYPTDTGPIDILAISKDKKTLLVVELKKGRASDAVVGQIQRYMGYVQEVLAEANQNVHGIIVAMEDDIRIRRALSVARNIEFYRYEIRFKLFKTSG